MIDRILSAGEYYHRRFPATIIFYRTGDEFTAFQEDAATVSEILKAECTTLNSRILTYSIPLSDDFRVSEILHRNGLSAKFVSCRDENGVFSVPDVSLIESEEQIDY